MPSPETQRIGLWLIGARGGVAVTAIAGIIAQRLGLADGAALVSELPQFARLPLAKWDDIVIGGHEIRVQCAKAGLKCVAAPNKETVGACAGPTTGDGAACNSGLASRCVGNNVQYCAGGKTRNFFCKSLGFSKCVGGPGQAHCAL